jgi:hypothetical protein
MGDPRARVIYFNEAMVKDSRYQREVVGALGGDTHVIHIYCAFKSSFETSIICKCGKICTIPVCLQVFVIIEITHQLETLQLSTSHNNSTHQRNGEIHTHV